MLSSSSNDGLVPDKPSALVVAFGVPRVLKLPSSFNSKCCELSPKFCHTGSFLKFAGQISAVLPDGLTVPFNTSPIALRPEVPPSPIHKTASMPGSSSSSAHSMTFAVFNNTTTFSKRSLASFNNSFSPSNNCKTCCVLSAATADGRPLTNKSPLSPPTRPKVIIAASLNRSKLPPRSAAS